MLEALRGAPVRMSYVAKHVTTLVMLRQCGSGAFAGALIGDVAVRHGMLGRYGKTLRVLVCLSPGLESLGRWETIRCSGASICFLPALVSRR